VSQACTSRLATGAWFCGVRHLKTDPGKQWGIRHDLRDVVQRPTLSFKDSTLTSVGYPALQTNLAWAYIGRHTSRFKIEGPAAQDATRGPKKAKTVSKPIKADDVPTATVTAGEPLAADVMDETLKKGPDSGDQALCFQSICARALTSTAFDQIGGPCVLVRFLDRQFQLPRNL